MYRYYANTAEGIIYCVSRYAGKIVRGKAKCSIDDDFDETAGSELAKARCDLKVAEKRKNNAQKKYDEAERALAVAKARMNKMKQYKKDSVDEYNKLTKYVKSLASSM